MFCENCGKPTEGEQTLCNECAAAKQAEQPVVEQPVVEQPIVEQPVVEQPVVEQPIVEQPVVEQPVVEQPVVEQPIVEQPLVQPINDTFDLNTIVEEPAIKAPKKKKRGWLIGLISVGAVAVAAAIVVAVGMIFNIGAIEGFIGRTFKSPEDYLADVEGEAISEYTAEMTKLYGQVLGAYSSGQPASAAKGSYRLILGDEVLSLLETTLQQQGMDMELDWLSDVQLSIDANIQDEAMQMGMGLGLGSGDLLSVDSILDMEDGKIYLAIPELNKDYLYIDMASNGANVDPQMLAAYTELYQDLAKDLPSEEEMNEMINRYVQIALSNIQNVEKETETISVGDASQKMVVLTAKIKQKDMLVIAEKVLKAAEKDKTLKKVIQAYENYMVATYELNGIEVGEVDLYEQFKEVLPDALDSIDAAKDDADSSNYIKLSVFVDMQNNVRGHELTVYADGEKGETISWLTAAKGDTVYTEADFVSGQIIGEKTDKKGVSEGFYELTVEDQKVGSLEFENVTETSGTLRLIPSEEIMSQALAESGIPSALLGDNLALELSYNATETSATGTAKIVMGSKTLFGLELSSEPYEGGKISIPSDAQEFTGMASLEQWIKDADFDTVLDDLESAGFPKELVESARNAIEMIKQY